MKTRAEFLNLSWHDAMRLWARLNEKCEFMLSGAYHRWNGREGQHRVEVLTYRAILPIIPSRLL